MPRPDRARPRPASGPARVIARYPRLALRAGLGLAALAFSATSQFSARHALLINASPSLPYWAIWLDRDAVPQRGDLILFDPPPSALLTRHFGAKPKPFGKRVYGVGGDVVSVQGRTFFVNGHAVAVAKEVSRFGEPLALGPTGIIPKACYFAATQHKDSFDSRYAAIGWICRARMLGTGSGLL